MLPKKLHYIWIGNSKTELANKCIESYYKFMSDYEIIEWNESNISSLNLDGIYISNIMIFGMIEDYSLSVQI